MHRPVLDIYYHIDHRGSLALDLVPLLQSSLLAMSHGINKVTAERNQRTLIELAQKPGNGKYLQSLE